MGLPAALEQNKWQPGQSGAPPGPRKGRGLAKRIRDVIGDDPTGIVCVLHDLSLIHI